MNDGEVGVRGNSGSSGRRGDGGGWSRDDEAIGAGVRVGGMMVFLRLGCQGMICSSFMDMFDLT